MRNIDKRKNEFGAALIEYAVAAGILVVVFAASAVILQAAGASRFSASVGVVKRVGPCIENNGVPVGPLSGEDCL